MAICGLIPRDLANIDPPTCPGYAYGKARCRQGRHKGIRNRKSIRKAICPGAVVGVDQLVSPTPSSVPIHWLLPTKKRYVGATIFVDHYSDLTYCHLMDEMNATSTVAVKEAFQRMATSHGVRI